MLRVPTASRPIAAVLALGALLLATRAAPAIEIRGLFVPFNGPTDLGRSVGTILALQFWQTLVKLPPGGRRRDLGDGSVYWIGRQVPIRSHDDAAKLAQAIDVTAQFAFWGHVHTLDEGAFATPYLTLPDYRDFRLKRNETWVLQLPARSPDTISVDVPQRVYAFRPIEMPTAFVRKYSVPDALEMRAGKGSGAVLGRLGVRFDRIQNDGEYAKVHSNGKIGWVHLPQIGVHQSEIVDFLGGVMRMYRTHWEGAIDLFGNVLKNRNARTALRIDTLLYIIRAKSEIGQPADAEVAEALKLAPASKEAVQYVAMHYLARCIVRRVPGCKAADEAFLASLPDKYGRLFGEGDPWLAQIRELARKG